MIYIILVLGLILRLINLNQSLWLDEAISAIAVKDNSLNNLIFSFMSGDVHPPLHYILLWLWGRIFGFSEISLRLPSVLLGVALVYIVYLISKSLFSKKIGLYSAIIVAFNPLLIYYSQEARMYSLNVFLTVVSFLFFILYLQKRKYSFFGLTLTNLLLLYSDYVLSSVLVVQVVYLIIFERKKLLKFLISLLLSLLGFLLWIPIFLNQLGLGKQTLSSLSKWAEIVGGLNAKNFSLVFIKAVIGRISFDNKIIYACIGAGSFILYSYLGFLAIRRIKKENYLILLWLVTPVVIIALISLYLPVLAYHRLIFIVPALIILIAIGMQKLSKNLQIGATILILSISSLSLFLYYTNPKFQREDWRGAVQFMEDKKPSMVLLEDNNIIAPIVYYSKDNLNLIPGLKIVPARLNEDLIDIKKLNSVDIYLAEYLVDITDPQRLLQRDLIDKGYKQKNVYNFNGVGFITLYSYQE